MCTHDDPALFSKLHKGFEAVEDNLQGRWPVRFFQLDDCGAAGMIDTRDGDA